MISFKFQELVKMENLGLIENIGTASQDKPTEA
jgi:hypothetical protein